MPLAKAVEEVKDRAGAMLGAELRWRVGASARAWVLALVCGARHVLVRREGEREIKRRARGAVRGSIMGLMVVEILLLKAAKGRDSRFGAAEKERLHTSSGGGDRLLCWVGYAIL